MRMGLAFTASVGVCSAAMAQATFTPVGFLTPTVPYSQGLGVCAGGGVTVGSSLLTGGIGGQSQAFWWTAEQGMNAAFGVSGASSAAAGGTPDGAVIVGWADFGSFSPLGAQAFIYVRETGATQLLGDYAGSTLGVPHSFGRGISADGLTVVGTGNSAHGTEAFVCPLATGVFTGLGALSQANFASWATGVSADGSVVVGSSYSAPQQLQGFRWTSAGGMVAIPLLTPAAGVQAWGQAEAVSASGQVVIGESRSVNSGNGQEAFRWTAAGGTVGLGDLPGGAFQSFAYATTPDGSVVVGSATIDGPSGPFGGGSAPRSFIWDAVHGMRDLQQLLIEDGVDLTGWQLQDVRGISADGRTLSGSGTNPQGQTEAWVATLPATVNTCYANCDGSTAAPVLNVLDFTCFLQRFAAADAWANCDGSTAQPALNVLDFTCFLQRFAAGCP